MAALDPLRAALQALRRHPAVLLPAAGMALLVAPTRFFLLVGTGEAVAATTNLVRVLTFLLTPYFLGLVVADGVRALDDDGPTIGSAFAPDSHYGRLLLAGLVVAALAGFGLVLTGLALRAVDVVGLLLLVLPLAVLVATQFYPVYVVHDDAGILAGLAASVSLFELHPGRVLQFSAVAVGLWALPDLLVFLAWNGLTGSGTGGPGGLLGAPLAVEPALALVLAGTVVRTGTVALRWTYAVAFCRDLA